MAKNKSTSLSGTFLYHFFRIICVFYSRFIMRTKRIRNELKKHRGACIILCNHEMNLDFTNMYSATYEQGRGVMSKAFYETTPLRRILKGIGIIEKQQFQTNLSDIRRMKAVIDAEKPLVLYPAGLSPVDGGNMEIPASTYKLLKMLNSDVLISRTYLSYFIHPKWSKSIRRGKTYSDIYRLFTEEEVGRLSELELKEKIEEALYFDAYHEQEKYKVKFHNNDDIRGLENVLYACPCCKMEFTMVNKQRNQMHCTSCGYLVQSDVYGFLNRKSSFGPDIRYVSDWSRDIRSDMEREFIQKPDTIITEDVIVQMIDYDKRKFINVGEGKFSVSKNQIILAGYIGGEEQQIIINSANCHSLPCVPGKYIEVQNGLDIYRCFPKDSRVTVKLLNAVSVFHSIKTL